MINLQLFMFFLRHFHWKQLMIYYFIRILFRLVHYKHRSIIASSWIFSIKKKMHQTYWSKNVSFLGTMNAVVNSCICKYIYFVYHRNCAHVCIFTIIYLQPNISSIKTFYQSKYIIRQCFIQTFLWCYHFDIGTIHRHDIRRTRIKALCKSIVMFCRL